jgi:type II secretion system protein C
MSVAPNKDSRLGFRIFSIASKVFLAAIGVWVATQIYPHWEAYQKRQPPKPDAPSLTQQPLAPPPAPDVTTSLLGTNSSTSEKPLQLVLVGTVPAATLADSRAMLGVDPRNPQTFAGGAILSNGARIAEIHADRIVLRLNGRNETLKVDREAPARVAMASVVNEQREQKGYPILESALSEGTEGSATSIGGSKARFVETKATTQSDVADIVRAVPVFENNKMAGFRLLAGTSGGRLPALGLQVDDIVRSIEGKYIESDAAWMRIEEAIAMGDKLVIGIERQGAMQTMTLDGAKLDEGGAPSSAPPAIAQSL